jgi:Tol biopolymer transport system component
VSHSILGAFAGADGSSYAPFVSTDGEVVVFESSAADLIAGYSGAQYVQQVFQWRRSTNEVRLVSHATNSATEGASDGAWSVSAADSGTELVFVSYSSNLTAQPPSGQTIYYWSESLPALRVVSHSFADTSQPASGESYSAEIARDGSAVAFLSYSADLVDGYSGFDLEVFVWNRSDEAVQLVSHAIGSTTEGAAGYSDEPSISRSGEFVAFHSDASNLTGADSLGMGQVYRWRRSSGEVELVTHAAGDAGAVARESVPMARRSDS